LNDSTRTKSNVVQYNTENCQNESYWKSDLISDVSSVKHQGKCGSCVAFATMAAVEFCFRNLTGKFGDYSEQELIDCGYGHFGADGCHDAQLYSYLNWMIRNDYLPASEEQYRYSYNKPSLQCPRGLGHDEKLQAEVTDFFYISEGSEKLLMERLLSHGAVISSITVHQELKDYRGGIFEGCEPNMDINHAVLVVGYGTDDGVDYWHIKNSWGVAWGEDGFMRLRRGAEMCGIGQKLAGVECGFIGEQDADGDVSDDEEK